MRQQLTIISRRGWCRGCHGDLPGADVGWRLVSPLLSITGPLMALISFCVRGCVSECVSTRVGVVSHWCVSVFVCMSVFWSPVRLCRTNLKNPKEAIVAAISYILLLFLLLHILDVIVPDILIFYFPFKRFMPTTHSKTFKRLVKGFLKTKKTEDCTGYSHFIFPF